jgi:predicted RNA binding protein YcfA (HicA-like mRNA interferase family)
MAVMGLVHHQTTATVSGSHNIYQHKQKRQATGKMHNKQVTIPQ